MREVDDPVGLKGRGEETVVLNDHSLHRVLGGHEQGSGAGDIHRGDVVEPALGSTEAGPALVQPSRRFGLHPSCTPVRRAWAVAGGWSTASYPRGLSMMVAIRQTPSAGRRFRVTRRPRVLAGSLLAERDHERAVGIVVGARPLLNHGSRETKGLRAD